MLTFIPADQKGGTKDRMQERVHELQKQALVASKFKTQETKISKQMM